jgi:hypothetical protein
MLEYAEEVRTEPLGENEAVGKVECHHEAHHQPDSRADTGLIADPFASTAAATCSQRFTAKPSRLNYGMISLIPKTKEAKNIKQYRPICLLNVDYKWFTKTLTLRLTPQAKKLISETQSTFIPGRYIVEGVVILHEV